MFADIITLILSIAAILLCAELFTNGIEWFGHIFKLSERTIGSVLAAIGTSLPETVVPFIAVICFGKSHGDDVSIGAITGAPFMLITLAFAACGAAAWFFSQKKRQSSKLNMDSSIVVRNLQLFLACYSIALCSAFLSLSTHLRWLIAFCLFSTYPLYVFCLFALPANPVKRPERLHLSRLLLRESNHAALVTLQVLFGVTGIVFGAYIFVQHLQTIADSFHISPLLMSLVVTPIATELPEQATAVMWARRGKYTLALANVTGSMVFQSCFPVAFGVAFTSWKLNTPVIVTGIVTLCLTATYLFMAKKKILTPAYLMYGALGYFLWAAAVWLTG
jgi:cation:H+ antiporter